jgi:hypothetical protein
MAANVATLTDGPGPSYLGRLRRTRPTSRRLGPPGTNDADLASSRRTCDTGRAWAGMVRALPDRGVADTSTTRPSVGTLIARKTLMAHEYQDVIVLPMTAFRASICTVVPEPHASTSLNGETSTAHYFTEATG